MLLSMVLEHYQIKNNTKICNLSLLQIFVVWNMIVIIINKFHIYEFRSWSKLPGAALPTIANLLSVVFGKGRITCFCIL